MNADNAIRELALAAYDLAEAETALRSAQKRITESSRRIAAIHAEINAAKNQSLLKKNKQPK
jgi:hypothetical protein